MNMFAPQTFTAGRINVDESYGYAELT